MAINLHTRYAADIQKAFSIGSILQGRLNEKFKFVGAKTVVVSTIMPVPMNDYKRSGTSRYGAVTEVQDIVQELTMNEDRSFTGSIDKGNSKQQCINKAGAFLKVQLDQEAIPEKDTHGFKVLSTKAGKIVGGAALTKDNINSRLLAARTHFTNKRVPKKNRTWYVRSDMYSMLLDYVTAFVPNEKLAKEAFVNGQVGMMYNAPVVEVPEDLLPANVNFLLVHKDSACSPSVLNETKLHIDPPGISGNLVEGRQIYDTFIIGARADGIYCDVETGAGKATVTAAPTIAAATGVITAASGCTVKYTTDGSDPRYSKSAEVGTAPTVSAGDVVKAYQYKGGQFDSGVAEIKVTG